MFTQKSNPEIPIPENPNSRKSDEMLERKINPTNVRDHKNPNQVVIFSGTFLKVRLLK